MFGIIFALQHSQGV